MFNMCYHYAAGVKDSAVMTDLQKKMMTCATSDKQTCAAPCVLEASGACHLPETELITLMFGELDEGGAFFGHRFSDNYLCITTSSRSTASHALTFVHLPWKTK